MELLEEVEIEILRNVFKELVQTRKAKAVIAIHVDDETDPFNGTWDRSYVVNKLAVEKAFSFNSSSTETEILNGVPVKFTYIKVNAETKTIVKALFAKENVLKWIKPNNNIIVRGRLLFDEVTGEAKLGELVKAFKKKQLSFMSYLVVKGAVDCKDMYSYIHPKTSKAILDMRSATTIIREIELNILKPIKLALGITGIKKNANIFKVTGKAFELIG